jgi:hypothetical protein
MPLAEVVLTKKQLQDLASAVETHPGSVRLEQLIDGHVRLRLVGPDGDVLTERVLRPV